MRWVCLFLGTSRLKQGSVIANHTRISLSIPRSFSHCLLLISVRAENPYSQSHEDANGKIILMALTLIIE